MGADSAIQWTTHTFNPWRGCTHVSPGCEHCYAETLSKRNPATLGVWGANGTRVVASESYWRQPVRWDKAAAAAERAACTCMTSGLRLHAYGCPGNQYRRPRVFCASLADVFEDRPELVAPRARLFALIDQTPHLDWLLLTKRPANITRLMEGYLFLEGWPPNAWLGFTAEDQRRFDERWADVLALFDRFRGETYRPPVIFVSAEPLLGPLSGLWTALDDFGGHRTIPKVDWLIVGGESGGKARSMDLAWARSLVEQGRTAGVPVFVKQLGRRPVHDDVCGGVVESCLVEGITDSHGGDPDEWPPDLRVREFPGGAS